MPNTSFETNTGPDPNCPKCDGKGWYSYDENHGTICDACCPCDEGWWLLKEHYGDNNGKYCCKRGCGKTKTPAELGIVVPEFIPPEGKENQLPVEPEFRRGKRIIRMDDWEGRPDPNTERCHSHRDGECNWRHCPQLRDNEPAATGRHCPYDRTMDPDWEDYYE